MQDWLPAQLHASPLCEQALTHRSASGTNYERLEFLGDALLGFVIGEWLYRQFPKASEGDLSRLRAALVKRETLASIAREHRLGDHLRLGTGELKSGGYRRDSILADTVEALIGAHYLVLGDDATRDFVLTLYGNRLRELPSAESLKDPKTRLQEFLQSRGLPLPEYTLLETRGEDHRQTFRIACRLKAYDLDVEAIGTSRRKAEQATAESALAQLQAMGAIS
ncbi:ribonuclease III [Acidihalobacter ferrooxydans]|uniref:Ribonuclease 3 n=1 Tax=Acidihalobacter ferrooxydans TaxID=1765967 RepID=A0A1P8ULF0_9GAMM|nr:ribonuclease III [Acidihalobacter ferrooxydans]